MSTVIIGGGHGGIQVAESLRAGGYQAAITIIDTAPDLPYQRPPLSKDYMKVGFDAAPLPLREEDFYAAQDINLRRGTTALSIDRTAREVHTDSGVLGFEHLVLATGARPRELSCAGADASGVHTLKTLDDASRLRTEVERATRVVVVGAGFIGMEFAVAALKHGCEVTVLEFAGRPMARALTPFSSAWFSGVYEEHGIILNCGEGLASIEQEPSGQAVAVHSTTGNRYPADLVVVGIGVAPNVEIAEAAGLDVANGVVVDRHLRSTDPHIFAIGDCASFPLPDNAGRLRLESVQNATDQARHVAAGILGATAPYAVIPWFWSTQGRYRLQMTGVVHADDDIHVIGDPGKKKFSVLAFRDGLLIGAESVNQPADQTIVRRMFAERIPLTLEEARAGDFDLRRHLKHAISTPA